VTLSAGGSPAERARFEDIAIVRAGARRVVGVDYSTVAASAAARRARELGVTCDYVVAELPPAPLRKGVR
jgi:hypothetical protein